MRQILGKEDPRKTTKAFPSPPRESLPLFIAVMDSCPSLESQFSPYPLMFLRDAAAMNLSHTPELPG